MNEMMCYTCMYIFASSYSMKKHILIAFNEIEEIEDKLEQNSSILESSYKKLVYFLYQTKASYGFNP